MTYSKRDAWVERARQQSEVPAEELVQQSTTRFPAGLVASTSFGIQSAVLLHMISRVAPDLPVIWVDTGYLPAETYRYAATLTERFTVRLYVYQSTWSPARMEAVLGRLWESEDASGLDRYHALRKVEPMRRALDECEARAWISGIRRDQTRYRHAMSRVMEQDGVLRIHPLFYWSDDDIQHYFEQHQLPRHPLERAGYRTVGDRHLSSPVPVGHEGASGTSGDHPAGRRGVTVRSYRETRFTGKREECGLHLSRGDWDALFT